MTDNSLPGSQNPIPVSPLQTICEKCGFSFYTEKLTRKGTEIITRCPECKTEVRKGQDCKGANSG